MLRKGLLLAVVLLGIGSVAFAQDEPAVPPPAGEIHGVAGVTYDTRYIWRGILVYGADSAIHPFVDLDLMGSGFHLEVIGHRANASGHELGERWDYALYYAGAANPDQACETRYMVGYRYFNYPDLSSHTTASVDLQEVFAGFSFPKLLGVDGLTPSYVVLKTWPGNSGTVVGSANPNGGSYSGWAHIFMLDYGVPMTNICPEMPAQMLNLHAETVFNDGVDPRPLGGYTDSDWTHLLLGASTDFDLGSGMSLTPALYYQITFEDNGNKGPNFPVGGVYQGINPDHDMLWASLTLKYKF
jgi:hypothetical protein